MRKYAKDHEAMLLEAINQLRGRSLEEIVMDLNHMGMTNASGNPWTLGALEYFMRTRERKLAASDPSHGIPRLLAEALLTEPTLTDRQKVGMFLAYLNA